MQMQRALASLLAACSLFSLPALAAQPPANGEEQLSSTLEVAKTATPKDFGFKRIHLKQACAGDSESQPAVMKLKDGAHIKNLIVGKNAGNGIVCEGSCTLENVWWEDVCEDAATMEANPSKSVVMTIKGGGAVSADDKVFQHNGAGKLVINGFEAKNIGKLARSCGTCKSNPLPNRTFDIQNVTIDGLTDAVVGLQSNRDDRALVLKNIKVVNAKNASKEKDKAAICKLYQFMDNGKKDPLFEKNGPAVPFCSWGSDVSISYKN